MLKYLHHIYIYLSRSPPYKKETDSSRKQSAYISVLQDRIIRRIWLKDSERSMDFKGPDMSIEFEPPPVIFGHIKPIYGTYKYSHKCPVPKHGPISDLSRRVLRIGILLGRIMPNKFRRLSDGISQLYYQSSQPPPPLPRYMSQRFHLLEPFHGQYTHTGRSLARRTFIQFIQIGNELPFKLPFMLP